MPVAGRMPLDLAYDAGQGLGQGLIGGILECLCEGFAEHHERKVWRGLVDRRQANVFRNSNHHLISGQHLSRLGQRDGRLN
jgi:hypothetical protein